MIPRNLKRSDDKNVAPFGGDVDDEKDLALVNP